jgi:hypothetical protein
VIRHPEASSHIRHHLHAYIVTQFLSSSVLYPSPYSVLAFSNSEDHLSPHSLCSVRVISLTLSLSVSLSLSTLFLSFPPSILSPGVFGMSLDQTLTIQRVYGPFEAVFVLTFAIIVFGIPFVLYYLERTGALPRMVRFRKKNTVCLKGPDVMGITSMM